MLAQVCKGKTMKKLLLAGVCALAALSQSVAQTVPPAVSGLGTLSVTNASTLASTMTLGPSSSAWPTSSSTGMVFVLNDSASAGNLYVCPLGGTCTTANGLELIPGRSWGFYRPATSMTVIATSTATAQFQW